MTGAILERETLYALIQACPPLLEGWVDLDAQLQPHGFDLSLREVASFQRAGWVGAGGEREVAPTSPLPFGADGSLHLPPGAYLMTFNEVVRLPRDLMALAFPRSTLLRCGVSVHNAVWDAGYHGRSQALLVVFNPGGFRVARNARLVHMVFFRLERPTSQGYRGRYQGENLGR
ncbi:MAG: deoxyuridine 5'-triphosphate nucleotidohydrolase [Dehalococcoidia bacterium]|nr:deoxyuridine 5'-triphosphate nucleotidohydrolase [Dehalococcoidia bacterium]MDW8120294.1 deoxyuridine 5'-triphosphate nucleotidohydrolase [Chloroflexota bacterium]